MFGSKKEFVFFLSLFMCFSLLSLGYSTAAQTPITLSTTSPESVSIHFIDVGQGDSILIKTPTKNILIDGGPTSAGTTLMNYLNAYQVSKIDLMVATHPHADHIGGLNSVLQSNITVQDIIYNGYNYTSTATFTTWKTLALTHNLTQGIRNQVYAISPTINFTVISPTSPTQFGSSTDDINYNSIVMRLQVGNVTVMLSGDAENISEQNILSSGFNIDSDVLKVGHHGSSTSTSQAFLSAVSPTYAVIFAGLNNTYGHPTQQTLDTLANNNVTTYITYRDGTMIYQLNSIVPPIPEVPPFTILAIVLTVGFAIIFTTKKKFGYGRTSVFSS